MNAHAGADGAASGNVSPRDFVGYADRPPVVVWPGGARLAVSVALNYEEGAERSIALGDDADEAGAVWGGYTARSDRRSRMKESFYEYGSRVGVWRMLEILQRHEAPATVFACGMALERNPRAAAAIAEAGHEVCSHGYRWASHHGMSRDEEQDAIGRATDVIEKLCGRRPVGWYSRDGLTDNSRSLLRQAGYLYDSNAYNDDLPYYIDVDGGSHLVVPYAGDTNDARFWSPPGFATSRDFFTVLKDTADCLLHEGADVPKMMSVGIHLRIGGRPSVAVALDDFLTYLEQQDGVWIARREDIARTWREQFPPQEGDGYIGGGEAVGALSTAADPLDRSR